VKDENPVLHTLTKYHSKDYSLCEGVKDFSLKVYGELCVVLLPSGINPLPSGVNLLPSGINSLPSGNKPDGSELYTGFGGRPRVSPGEKSVKISMLCPGIMFQTSL
jgi:hypothetical protein